MQKLDACADERRGACTTDRIISPLLFVNECELIDSITKLVARGARAKKRIGRLFPSNDCSEPHFRGGVTVCCLVIAYFQKRL